MAGSRRSRPAFCIAIIALSLLGCGPSGEFAGVFVDGAAPAQSSSAADERLSVISPDVAQAAPSMAVRSRAQFAEYRISPQDIIDVSVYQVPDLNRSVQVDASGMAGLPLLGGVQAGGRTVRELEGDIAKRLGARYLQSPQVAVFVKDAAGLRVTVDGAVKKPGVIQVKGATTLLTALAEAQGFSDTADQSGVLIFRPTEHGRSVARFDAAAIRSGAASDPPVYGGDTIVVDESTTKTAWKQFREALPVASLFRLF